ncbi:acyltransferase domain-containing protein [Streptomyces jumonjinensis]|uniref:acyltransferase domain-containing protein n=1 Tax=Streptomyces jumonjinensis TaxID=1945 RepID=UPI0037B645C1
MTDTMELPVAEDLAGALLDLAVPHEDIAELLRLRGRISADTGLRRTLESAAVDLVRDMGRIGGGPELPRSEDLESTGGALARYFPVLVYVAALPAVRAYHRERAVPDGVSRRTLADLGRHMALHRRRRGTGGLPVPGWLALHFRGELYQLGRLQFQRCRLREPIGAAVRADGLPYGPGDYALGLHIPDFLGPLTPGACDRSLARAGEFFSRCYPEEPYGVAECHSWLLDPQLTRYLPEHSNIRGFQDRFRIRSDKTRVADGEPVEFVFGDPRLPLESLPRRTTLERAIVDHLRAGGHWYGGHGWFRL